MMDYSTSNEEGHLFHHYRMNNTTHIRSMGQDSSKSTQIGSTHLGATSFPSDSRHIGIRNCAQGQDNPNSVRFRINSTEQGYYVSDDETGQSSQSHFAMESHQPIHINVRNFLDNFEKQYQDRFQSSRQPGGSNELIKKEQDSEGFVITGVKDSISSKEYENTQEEGDERRIVEQKQVLDQGNGEDCNRTDMVTDLDSERVLSADLNKDSARICLENEEFGGKESEEFSGGKNKEEISLNSPLKKEIEHESEVICTDSRTVPVALSDSSECHYEDMKDEVTQNESLPSSREIPKTTPGRKNKRKISNARKRQKIVAPNSEITDLPPSGSALFTMLKKDSGGTMINVTEDSLKAMIEESLINITKAKNRSQGKAEIDTKNIVDESVKSVTAAVMAQASDSGSHGPSPSKKRRKKASPQKITKQAHVTEDVDYNPIMDEDTELEDNEDNTFTVKPKAKARKRRTRKKKAKTKEEPEVSVKASSGEELDQFNNGNVEGEGTKIKKKKREKKGTVPKEKKEKTPREKKALICEECGKVFMRNDLLRNHKRCHTGDKPFVCCECGISFREAGHLKRHMTIHTGKKPYKCDICGKELNSSLAKHKRRHLNDRQFPCSLCEKRFVSGFELKQHVQTHLKNEHIPCSICGKTCTNMTILKRHLQSHSDERKFPCPNCSQRFKSKQDCERHQTVHFATPTCTCHLCGKQFMQERYLKRHIDRHNRPQEPIEIEEPTPDKPYQCDVCFKIFASQANLTQHLSIHLRQGVYGCYICSKTFSQPRYLKRHIKRHLGEDVSPEEGEEEEGVVWEEEQLSHMVSPMNTEAQMKAMEARMQATVVDVAVARIHTAQMSMQATEAAAQASFSE